MTEQEVRVEDIRAWTKPGKDEHEGRVERFDQAYDIYRPKQGTKRRPSKMSVPFAQSNIDTALVNMVQEKPRCIVLPRTPDYTESARKFQLVMDYFAERDHLVEKTTPHAQQALIYGIAVGKNRWLYETRDRVGRRIVEDRFTQERHPITEQKTVVIYDGPTHEVWNVYDAWWDPNARSVDTADYFCLRSYVTKPYLLMNACSLKGRHNQEDCDGIYHNVEELLRSGPAPRRVQTAQEQRLRRSQDSRNREYEIVETWQDDRLTVIGNDKILMRDATNPHWHGRKPIVTSNTRPDVLELAGVPETELIDHLQQALWTNQRLRFENLLLTVQRMFTYRESGITDPKKIKIGPRVFIPVMDHDDLKPLEVPPLPPEVYREEAELLGRMQLITGISPWVSGADMQTVDQNTATGVATLSEVAGRLLKFKAAQLHWKLWQRTFEQQGNDIQQFLDHEIQIRIVNDKTGEVSWDAVTPTDVVGEYDFVLAAGGEASSKQQRQTQMLQLLNAIGPLIEAGIVNGQALALHVAETFDFAAPHELIQSPPPPAAPVNGQNGANGQAPANGPGPASSQALDPSMVQQLLATGFPGQTSG